MINIKSGVFFPILFILISCSGELGPRHDVQYYLDHADERNKVLKKCRNDAALQVHPNCQNAEQADFQRMLSGPNTVPPVPSMQEIMGWSDEETKRREQAAAEAKRERLANEERLTQAGLAAEEKYRQMARDAEEARAKAR